MFHYFAFSSHSWSDSEPVPALLANFLSLLVYFFKVDTFRGSVCFWSPSLSHHTAAAAAYLFSYAKG